MILCACGRFGNTNRTCTHIHYIYTYICVCVCVCVYMYVCVYVYMFVRMYVCMFVCMYAYIMHTIECKKLMKHNCNYVCNNGVFTIKVIVTTDK